MDSMPSSTKTLRAALVTGACMVTLGGCVDALTTPKCAPVTFSQAAVNGDTVTTTTGLRYIEGVVGSGLVVGWCHNIAVHYDAFLADGTKFDSSRDIGQPLIFAPGLGGLIDGFEQGVIGMHGGGTRRLIIPPELAFGSEARRDASGQVIVPGNSTLVYDIEIIQVGQ